MTVKVLVRKKEVCELVDLFRHFKLADETCKYAGTHQNNNENSLSVLFPVHLSLGIVHCAGCFLVCLTHIVIFSQ